PGYPYRAFATQYRYHGGAYVSGPGPRFDIAGQQHQLKSVFEPEQIEYYAQKLHRPGVLRHPSFAVRDAAYRLMLLDDASLAFTDESDNHFIVADIASKIISYDSQNRVLLEYLQASCGCAGSVTQGLRQTFTYSEWPSNGQGGSWPYGGRAMR